MLVHLDISMMPQLAEAVGRKALDVDFQGGSVGDLIGHIAARFGRKAREAIFDGSGEVDPVVKVVLNSDRFIVREKFGSTELHGGDRVKIMAFFAGG
jgi:molybdopterin converting factor small subunit